MFLVVTHFFKVTGNTFHNDTYKCDNRKEPPQLLGVGVSISSPNLLNSALSIMLATSSSESDLSEPEHLIDEFEITGTIGELTYGF